MQITTTKESLVAPLALVAGAADTRGTVPVLGSVLLKAMDNGQLSLLCSDTGMLARTLAPVEVKKPGELAVDVRRFYDLVKAVPDKQSIEIALEDKGTLLVKSGRSRFRLPTHAASDYPRMAPDNENRQSITMNARRLGEMVSSIIPSMADADLRPYLNGALFLLDSSGLWMVATDGHRMNVAHEPIEGADALSARSVIVPRKTVLLAKKLLGHGGNVTLTIGPRNVQFTYADGGVLLGQAIDGQYPTFQSVIPKVTDATALSASRLATALQMIAATSDDKDKQDTKVPKVEVQIAQSTLTIRKGDSGLCELECESSTDKPVDLAFNSRYLMDAVATLREVSDEIVIGFSATSAVSAITLKPVGKDYPLSVVMPLRS